MASIVQIFENDLIKLLCWDNIFEAVEVALESLTKGFASQSSICWTRFGKNSMVLLPGYISHPKYGGLACKLFTVKPDGEHTYVSLLDPTTGELKAMIHGNSFTGWRTAAASLIGAKHLHGLNGEKSNKILAVCGAGNQGHFHALAFQHYYNFEEVRIWNRTPKRAKDLAKKLNEGLTQPVFFVADTVEECLKNADVIVAATTSEQTIIKYSWVKPGAHITAIGVNPRILELDADTYRNSEVYVDSMENAKRQLTEIERLGGQFKAQIGDVIAKKVNPPKSENVTVFQSLGLGIEDCAVARMIYDAYMNESKVV